MLHGDEILGKQVLEKIDKDFPQYREYYDWVVSNEEAVKNNVRFIEFNMNRIAPGDLNSDSYEKRRVAQLIETAKKYKYVIDIHTTKSDVGIFTIISNPTIESIMLSLFLDIDNVVFWAQSDFNENNAFTTHVHRGIAIEVGPRGSKVSMDLLYDSCVNLLELISKKIYPSELLLRKKKFLKVVGFLSKEDEKKFGVSELENFKKININGEEYYPIMVGSYGVAAYLTKEVSWYDLLSHDSILLESSN